MTEASDAVPQFLVDANAEAVRLVRLEKYDEALEYCTSIISQIPSLDLWLALDIRAYVHWRRGDKTAAMKDIADAIGQNGSAASLRYKRAIWLVELGRFEEAVKDSEIGELIEAKSGSKYYLHSFQLIRAYSLLKVGKSFDAHMAVSSVPPEYSMWLAGQNINRSSIMSLPG